MDEIKHTTHSHPSSNMLQGRFEAVRARYSVERKQSRRTRKRPMFALRKNTAMCLVLVGMIAGELLLAAAVPVLSNTDKFYKLSEKSKSVLGKIDPELGKKITYDAKEKIYQYNKTAATDNPNSPEAALAAAENSKKVSSGPDKYSVDLSVDPKKGVTVRDATDTSGSLAVTLLPEFTARDGKQIDGRIVYPLKKLNGQMIYSVKGNGLKEDIVLDKYQGSELSFAYQLKLPNSLEARLLDNGGVGIYSADPALFGNISYGSDADRAKVETARTKGQKTNLVFAIPAPQIVQTGKGDDRVQARFELNGDQLTVKARGLDKASYPLSIDPSVVVTSATDFGKGATDGSIQIDTANGQMVRAGLTGGSVGSWTADSSPAYNNPRYAHATVVASGYIYIIGGCTSGNCSSITGDVRYAQLNTSDGSVGSWSSGGTLNTARQWLSAVAYNGYIYAIGGHTGGGASSVVEYARVDNASGTLSSWQTDAAFAVTGRFYLSAVAYNGYMYVAGGSTNGSDQLNTTRYAPIKGDGTLGTWNDGSTMVTAMAGQAYTVYNGYLYLVGGCSNLVSSCLSYSTTVQYVLINPDGTLGTWTTTSSLPTGKVLGMAVAHNGYLYMVGGQASGNAFTNNTYYAPINADGTLGTWASSTGITTGRYGSGVAAYNGYVYITGGCSAGSCTTMQTDVSYSKIDSAGVTGGYTTSGNTFATASYGATTVAYNGYLYVMGGCTASGCAVGSVSNLVRYAQINPDGSIGSFATSGNNLPAAMYGHASFAYNGRLYVVGGCGGVLVSCTAFSSNIYYSGLITGGNPAAWSTATNAFTTGRFLLGAAVHNGRVYIAGGCSAGACSGYQADVQYASIDNSSGDVGAFTGFGNFDSLGRFGIGMSVYGNHLYISGGYDSNNTVKNDVRYAEINPSTGAIVGSWGDAGNSFTTARIYHTMAVDKGFIYIAGGCTDSGCGTTLNNAQYARINNNGTIQAFAAAANLNTARHSAGVAVYNGYIYIVGGCTAGFCSGSFLNNVEIAPINNGGSGSISSFTTDGGTSFTTNRFAHTSVAYNGYVYVIGGCGSGYCSAALNDTQYAPINADGSIGAWADANTGAAFSTARFAHASAIYNGYLYVLGGRTGAGAELNDIQYVLICTGQNSGVDGCGSTAGKVGTWHTATNSFINGREGLTSTAYNGYLYVFGGYDGSSNYYNDVQYAAITGGNLGAWHYTYNSTDLGVTNPGNNGFSTGRYYHSTIQNNGYVYIVGGGTSGGVYLNDVQFAKLNANGTIGSWSATSNFVAGRYAHSSIVTNGFLYLVGGIGASGSYKNDVQYAAINANGTLGLWSTLPTTFTTARYAHSTVNYNGYLYILGGCSTNVIASCTTSQNDVQYAGLKVVSRKGTYSQLFDLGGDAVATKLLGSGTPNIQLSYKAAPGSSSTFGSSVSKAPSTSGSFISLNTSENRYYQLIFTLDDTQNAIFPDVLGSTSTLTDFELYFHPATSSGGSKRLRGGKTFTDQRIRSLDAQPN